MLKCNVKSVPTLRCDPFFPSFWIKVCWKFNEIETMTFLWLKQIFTFNKQICLDKGSFRGKKFVCLWSRGKCKKVLGAKKKIQTDTTFSHSRHAFWNTLEVCVAVLVLFCFCGLFTFNRQVYFDIISLTDKKCYVLDLINFFSYESFKSLQVKIKWKLEFVCFFN